MKQRSYFAKTLIWLLVLVFSFGVMRGIYAVTTPSDTRALPVYENLALGRPYQVTDRPANDGYPDDGTKLTDGVLAGRNFEDPAWVGFVRTTETSDTYRWITFDLEEAASVGRVTLRALHDYNVGVGFPEEVRIEVSSDGTTWHELASSYSAKDPAIQRPMIQEYSWDGALEGVPGYDEEISQVYTRYIRFYINFSRAWFFTDEIEIWGTPGKSDFAGTLPIDETDPIIDESDWPGYYRVGEDEPNNIVLLYNQHNMAGTWQNPDNIIPYLGYMDSSGTITDWMFDSVLYLAINTPSGNLLYANTKPSTQEDWTWYLDSTFNPEGDMAALDEAVGHVKDVLNDHDLTYPVYLAVPNPSMNQDDWGMLDDTPLSFNHKTVGQEAATENKQNALDWYLDEAMIRWEAGNYTHLRFEGFYWMNESLEREVPDERAVLAHTSAQIHAMDKEFLWIPFKNALGQSEWQTLGFDKAIIQPGYMFDDVLGPEMLKETAAKARQFGLGVELELHGNVIHMNDAGATTRAKYYAYMDYGLEEGYDGDVLKAYYQDGRAFLDASKSSEPEVRAIYDATYAFMRGTYTPGDIPTPTITPTPETDLIPNILSEPDATVSISSPVILNQAEWDQIVELAPSILVDGQTTKDWYSDGILKLNNRTIAEDPYTFDGTTVDAYLVHEMSLNMLEIIDYGIVTPEEVVFQVSEDGNTWIEIGTVTKENIEPTTLGMNTFYDYRLQVEKPVVARFYRAMYQNPPRPNPTDGITKYTWTGVNEFAVAGVLEPEVTPPPTTEATTEQSTSTSEVSTTASSEPETTTASTVSETTTASTESIPTTESTDTEPESTIDSSESVSTTVTTISESMTGTTESESTPLSDEPELTTSTLSSMPESTSSTTGIDEPSEYTSSEESTWAPLPSEEDPEHPAPTTGGTSPTVAVTLVGTLMVLVGTIMAFILKRDRRASEAMPHRRK